MGLKVFAFVRCLLFEHTCRELVLADDGWAAWSTKAFIRRPVMATPALDSAPVGHDPDNRARASDLNKLWHVSQEKKSWSAMAAVGSSHAAPGKGSVVDGRTFSCQLSSTLIAWPPPSPPPRACACEKPVGCGAILVVFAGGEACAMPL
jgi:hypothetical protein